MAFQLAYGEASVLDTALFIAIQEFESRLATPHLGDTLRAETEVQLRIARQLKERLSGKPVEWESNTTTHLPYPHVAGSVSDCPGCE